MKNKIYDMLPERYQVAFKSADIRGRYPNEINETLVYRIGYVLGTNWKLKSILVARDMRLSSPDLHKSLCLGLRHAGVEVYDLSLVPTTVLYFASGDLGVWGVMITASHNPKDFNGLKIVMPGAVPLTDKTGLNELKKYVVSEPDSTCKTLPKLRKISLIKKYLDTMIGSIDVKIDTDIKIICDAGNGMSAKILEKVPKKLGLSIGSINTQLDGNFPMRASNPMLRNNQKPIKTALKEKFYNLGVSFDGDGDRVAFFTPNGTMINGALVGAIIASELIKDNPGATFVNTVFTSRVYSDVVKSRGGKMKKAKVGHSYIKEQMRKHDAVFGCEHSGHYYFKTNFYADSSILALLYFLKALNNHGGDIYKLIKEYQLYYQTEEVLVEVVDKKKVLDTIVSTYDKGNNTVKKFDGVTVDMGDVWFTVKASVTEDALKYVVESRDKKLALVKQKEIHSFLKSYKK